MTNSRQRLHGKAGTKSVHIKQLRSRGLYLNNPNPRPCTAKSQPRSPPLSAAVTEERLCKPDSKARQVEALHSGTTGTDHAQGLHHTPQGHGCHLELRFLDRVSPKLKIPVYPVSVILHDEDQGLRDRVLISSFSVSASRSSCTSNTEGRARS
ncbi:hypothetical protein DPEC_G00380380 [Dallia pectoralis]|nr:hypothetical protein DPEC_G00380380 [Dallia pectoralis]